ncbi:MAG: choice-of-anchor B family protein [Gemmatimonadales bacterium]|nr:MAG: choice-of-anchor B family protein [Gemmatimonadales bacterium]
MKQLLQSALAVAFLALVAGPVTAQSLNPALGSDVDDVVASAFLSGFGGALAISDGQVLVGEGQNSLRPGIVYLYERGADGSWSETAQLMAPDSEMGDSFGSALAIDGDRMLVGAPEINRVFLMEREAGTWSVVGEMAGDDEGEDALFGAAVALMGDWALVGAPGAEETAGAALLFDGSDGWAQVARLTAHNGDEEGRFGASVALRDGEIFVGAPMAGGQDGTVYAFRADAGEWVEAGELSPRGDADDAVFGMRLLVHGDEILVGAPNLNLTGAVMIFTADNSNEGWIERDRLHSFHGTVGTSFGGALAVGDDALWIGVPLGMGRRGAVDRFFRTDEGWTGVERLSGDWTSPNNRYGSAIAVEGDVAAVAAVGTDGGAGAVVILERDADGVWNEAERLASEPEALPAILAESVMCEGGKAAIYDCENVEILSFLPLPDIGGERGIRMNDTWGWHDEETGREIVLAGRTDGVAFVDITDPSNPVYLGEVLRTEGSPTAAWRDFKVFNDHAFIVADASGQHGMQVFNLRRLDEFDGEPITWEPDLTYDRIHSAHNIGLNPETGYVYIVGASQGGETCGGGLHMVDVNDPMNPQFAGCFADPQTGRTGTGYSHDVQCVTYRGPDDRYFEREICMGSNETHLSVADVTDKENPIAVSRAAYPNVGYVHQGWFDEDHRYFYMQDELALMGGLIDNTRTVIFDLVDLEDPQVVGEFFFDSRAVSHNLYIVGDLMYEANYSSGLRIVDISDRENPQEVGYIDTAPTHEQEPMFEGAWSTYPFFESGSISISSIGEGLFIVRFHDPRPVS